MIRRFNYTDRGKIDRSRVTIDVMKKEGETPTFAARLNWQDLKLPSDARVFVESYQKTWYRRFPFGTVGLTKQPGDSNLEGAERFDFVRFRVKVVDGYGKILAEADGVLPRDLEPAPTERRCILHVDFVDDLGEQLWRLEYEPNQMPVLEVNRRIPLIGEQMRDFVKTPRFEPLVYSAAVRELLLKILGNGHNGDEDDSPETLWLRFVSTFYQAQPPEGEDADAREEWVTGAVAAFCEKMHLATSYGSFFSGEA